jgi:hypothetical protein
MTACSMWQKEKKKRFVIRIYSEHIIIPWVIIENF